MISHYKSKDYKEVKALLELCKLPTPSESEMNGYGLVWREDYKIVGFVWALVGEGGTVYVDLFCVDPDYRYKDKAVGRSKIAVLIMLQLLRDLKEMGKTRIVGMLPKGPVSESMERIYNAVGMKFFEPHAFCYGDIPTILDNLQHMHTKRIETPIIKGVVERGQQKAGQEGFPTANIKTAIEDGAYVGHSQHGSCLVVVGSGVAEVHIIGFDGDLTGSIVEVDRLKRIPDMLIKNYLEYYCGEQHEHNN